MLTFEQYCKQREEMNEAWLGRTLGRIGGHLLGPLGGGATTNALTKMAGSGLGMDIESDMGAIPGLFLGAVAGNLSNLPDKLSDLFDKIENGFWSWAKRRIFGSKSPENSPLKLNAQVVDNYQQAMTQLKSICKTPEFHRLFDSFELIDKSGLTDKPHQKGIAFSSSIVNDPDFIKKYYSDKDSIDAFLKILKRAIYNGKILIENPNLNKELSRKASSIVSGLEAIEKAANYRLTVTNKKVEEIIDLKDVSEEIPEEEPKVRFFNKNTPQRYGDLEDPEALGNIRKIPGRKFTRSVPEFTSSDEIKSSEDKKLNMGAAENYILLAHKEGKEKSKILETLIDKFKIKKITALKMYNKLTDSGKKGIK